MLTSLLPEEILHHPKMDHSFAESSKDAAFMRFRVCWSVFISDEAGFVSSLPL